MARNLNCYIFLVKRRGMLYSLVFVRYSFRRCSGWLLGIHGDFVGCLKGDSGEGFVDIAR
jgi:hypothetical protein